MKNRCIPLLLVLLLVSGCGQNKGGSGTGMFEYPNQEAITITYHGEVLQVTNQDKMQEIINLCKEYDWEECDAVSYTKEDCNIWIDFNTDRAVIGFVSDSSNGVLNNTPIKIPSSLIDIVNSLIDDL